MWLRRQKTNVSAASDDDGKRNVIITPNNNNARTKHRRICIVRIIITRSSCAFVETNAVVSSGFRGETYIRPNGGKNEHPRTKTNNERTIGKQQVQYMYTEIVSAWGLKIACGFRSAFKVNCRTDRFYYCSAWLTYVSTFKQLNGYFFFRKLRFKGEFARTHVKIISK